MKTNVAHLNSNGKNDVGDVNTTNSIPLSGQAVGSHPRPRDRTAQPEMNTNVAPARRAGATLFV